MSTNLGARLGDKNVAAEAAPIVLDWDRDLLARQAKRVKSPPQTPPANIAAAIDGRTGWRRPRSVEPAAAQPKQAMEFLGDSRDNLVSRCAGRHHLRNHLHIRELLGGLHHETAVSSIASRELSDNQTTNEQQRGRLDVLRTRDC